MDIKVRTEQVINGVVISNRLLETLAVVERHSSMTNAAKELDISVPVVHKYLSNISKAAGTPVTTSTPMGTKLTEEGRRVLDTYRYTEMRCADQHRFTICCSPVTEDLMMSVVSALKLTDVELMISDDVRNIKMMKENLADMAIVDDPLYLFDAEEFEGIEIGNMGMVYIDNGPSFIRYKYGAQRVAFMFLDTLNYKYTIESETFSLPELLGSNKSFFVDEFLLMRKGLRLKSAVDPKILRHAITAIYRKENKTISRIVKALIAKNIK